MNGLRPANLLDSHSFLCDFLDLNAMQAKLSLTIPRQVPAMAPCDQRLFQHIPVLGIGNLDSADILHVIQSLSSGTSRSRNPFGMYRSLKNLDSIVQSPDKYLAAIGKFIGVCVRESLGVDNPHIRVFTRNFGLAMLFPGDGALPLHKDGTSPPGTVRLAVKLSALPTESVGHAAAFEFSSEKNLRRMPAPVSPPPPGAIWGRLGGRQGHGSVASPIDSNPSVDGQKFHGVSTGSVTLSFIQEFICNPSSVGSEMTPAEFHSETEAFFLSNAVAEMKRDDAIAAAVSVLTAARLEAHELLPVCFPIVSRTELSGAQQEDSRKGHAMTKLVQDLKAKYQPQGGTSMSVAVDIAAELGWTIETVLKHLGRWAKQGGQGDLGNARRDYGVCLMIVLDSFLFVLCVCIYFLSSSPHRCLTFI
jgi:hypothetical protein